MKPYLVAFVLLIGPAVMLTLALLRKRRRALAVLKPFPEEWNTILRKRVPLFFKLPESLRQKLIRHINIFLEEKDFIGCQGIEIDDEIRVTIAAQACMLIMNRDSTDYEKLRTIYIYPSAYITKQKQMTASGVMVENEGVNLGESWSSGQVVLSWESTKHGAMNMKDGQNVVMHEFAHQLDQESGSADGCPILDQSTSYFTWGEVLGEEYNELLERTNKHRKSVMDNYGATNAAEFFAVATETFFEKPAQMKRKHPELYEELKDYYHLAPEEWL